MCLSRYSKHKFEKGSITMKISNVQGLIFAILLIFIQFSCDDHPASNKIAVQDTTDKKLLGKPIINSISPDTTKAFNLIKISGLNFGTVKGTVFIDTLQVADIQLWSDTLITFNLPAAARSGSVYVKVQNAESNKKQITIDTKITIDSKRTLNRCGWYAGDTIMIYGANFGDSPVGKIINFNEYFVLPSTIANIISYSDTLIVTQIPFIAEQKSTLYNLSFYISDGNSDYNIHIVNLMEPNIKSIEPTIAFPNTQVSLFGNFDCISGLYLDGKSIPYTLPQNNVLNFIVPSEAKSGKLKFVSMNRTSNEINLIVREAAVIDSISPQYAKIGDEVTVYGRNFGTLQDASYLQMNRGIKPDNYTFWDNNRIKFKIPGQAVSGNITLMYNGQVPSNSVYYNIKLNPDYGTMMQFTKLTFYKLNGESLFEVPVHFSGDTLITEARTCLDNYDIYPSKILFNKSNGDMAVFDLQYCYGNINAYTGTIDRYLYTGRNMKLISISNNEYNYESSDDFPAQIFSGYHYWIYKIRISGGKIETSQGTDNPTKMSLRIVLSN